MVNAAMDVALAFFNRGQSPCPANAKASKFRECAGYNIGIHMMVETERLPERQLEGKAQQRFGQGAIAGRVPVALCGGTERLGMSDQEL